MEILLHFWLSVGLSLQPLSACGTEVSVTLGGIVLEATLKEKNEDY